MADKEILRKTFKSSVDFLHDLRQAVRGACFECGASSACIDGLVMAANEAFANIIKHGYGGNDQGEVSVRIAHNDEEVRVVLEDKAPHVKLAEMQGREPDDIRPGGLGLYFIRKLMDRVEYPEPEDGKGNVIVLIKKKQAK